MATGTIRAIVRDGDGNPTTVVGPVADRNAIKTALAPFKRYGATAVVVGSDRARTGTEYAVINGTRHGRTTYGSGFWARGERVDLTDAEITILRGTQ